MSLHLLFPKMFTSNYENIIKPYHHKKNYNKRMRFFKILHRLKRAVFIYAVYKLILYTFGTSKIICLLTLRWILFSSSKLFLPWLP
nr:putative transmembrane protein [Phocid alphaherpesvirus 1]